MPSRPTVGIVGADGKGTGSSHPLPAVFSSPIRPDICHITFRDMNKNRRQPYAVSKKAGHQTSAESWGTGMLIFWMNWGTEFVAKLWMGCPSAKGRRFWDATTPLCEHFPAVSGRDCLQRELLRS